MPGKSKLLLDTRLTDPHPEHVHDAQQFARGFARYTAALVPRPRGVPDRQSGFSSRVSSYSEQRLLCVRKPATSFDLARSSLTRDVR